MPSHSKVYQELQYHIELRDWVKWHRYACIGIAFGIVLFIITL